MYRRVPTIGTVAFIMSTTTSPTEFVAPRASTPPDVTARAIPSRPLIAVEMRSGSDDWRCVLDQRAEAQAIGRLFVVDLRAHLFLRVSTTARATR